MNQTPGWLLIVVIASAASMAAGVLLGSWWIRRAAKKHTRIPKHWPLDPRLMANTEERKVWRWLRQVFFDHHVMVKIPVTRFTLPRTKEQGPHWYKMLNGVYCTFTVCAADGHVIGCVDVPGHNGISKRSRQLKLTLLSQCGIAYWVIKSVNLPTPAEIRIEFLGEMAPMGHDRDHDHNDEAAIATARLKLRTAIDRRRQHIRRSEFHPFPTPKGGSECHLPLDNLPSNFTSDWHQENSFLVPLDSRAGELR